MAMQDQPKLLTPKLRFPEFRTDWGTKPLDAIAQPITERAGNRPITPYTVTTGVGLVSQQDRFGRTIAGSAFKNYYVLRKNDFAYNKSATKAYPQGYIARFLGEEGAVPNSIFTCFRADPDAVNPAYLDYLFAGNLHGKWLRRFIEVSARAHGSLSIDDADLMSLPVPVPEGTSSAVEQRKIAACLTLLDELLAAEGRKLEALRDHKKGLMQQLFPREGESRPRLRFPEFLDKPEWEEKSLCTVANYENGKAYEQDIHDDGKYVVVNSKFISSEGAVRKYSNADYCIATVGDVLMVLSDLPNGRALAKCFFVDENNRFAVNQRVARLTPSDIHPLFLYYRINRHSRLLAFDDGLSQTHLSKASVVDCRLCVPPNHREQERIAACLSSLDDLIVAQSRKLDGLRAHKKGLMQQLFPSPEGE